MPVNWLFKKKIMKVAVMVYKCIEYPFRKQYNDIGTF